MKLDVISTDSDGLYFLVTPGEEGIRGTLLDEGDGWWTGVYSGHKKRFWCPSTATRPELKAAEQLTGT